ncbi:MAG: endonuclease/exonuclease/phosphatase family protein [Verrucomicrobiia bacterium]
MIKIANITLLLALVLSTGWQTCAGELRVLTYNIHHGEGTDGKLDLKRIADVILSARPDLVALQEVDNRTQRTGQVDQAAELARLTGFHAVFGKAFDFQGGQYGAAILSRWPFEKTEPRVLPGSERHEIRPALTAWIKTGATGPVLTLISTHFDHQSEQERLTQAKRLLEYVADDGGRPIILAGDFNALVSSPVMNLFEPGWLNPTASKPLFTIPSGNPSRQIDFVLFQPKDSWRMLDARVLDSNASDHCALLVVAEFSEDATQ